MPVKAKSKSKSSPSPNPSPGSGIKTALQKFTYREIPRSEILLDPENPRSISPLARKRLKAKIQEVGCVEPLVWNEKAGMLVGGHQRISIMDELEGYPDKVKDYTVAVAVVRLTERQHRALSIFLNNSGAQGQFERDPFFALLQKGVSLDDIGYSKVDLEFEFGDLSSVPGIDSMFAPVKKAAEPVAQKLAGLADIKDRKKKVREQNAAVEPEQDADYYLMVCWNNRDEKVKWLASHGQPEGLKMMSAEEFMVLVKGEGKG